MNIEPFDYQNHKREVRNKKVVKWSIEILGTIAIYIGLSILALAVLFI